MPLMGYREYARHRNCTLRAVQEAIDAGRIKTTLVDRKQKIDQEQADKDWEVNTSHQMRNNGAGTPEKVLGPSFNQSRAIREAYQAKLAKLEYEMKSERVVDAEQVKREAFELSRMIRDALLNVPSRISNELMACKNAYDIEQVMLREFNKILKELSSE